MFHNDLYAIGCPVWSCPGWKGSVYPVDSPQRNWLAYYSKVFGVVEGNSTFYGIPGPESFKRWGQETDSRFRFCLKFPRIISHDLQLRFCDEPLDQFLRGLDILAAAERLGPTFLQLGPSFCPRQLPTLQNFLDRLLSDMPFAVEVRHPDWFVGDAQQRLFAMLAERKVDRVIFDSRPLYALPPSDASEEASQKRKPRVPIRDRVAGHRPMLRLIGRNKVDECDPAIEAWTAKVAEWISDGFEPIVFTHTPDDRWAPGFALRFHQRLAERVPTLPTIDGWPCKPFKQNELF